MDKNLSTAAVKTPSSNFTGDVWMKWHSHVNGQLLVCTDGIGPVGTRDGEATIWLEPVTDEQYLAAHSKAGV
jgi:hypothetical protein